MAIATRDVTPADAEALAHILVATNEATYRGIVPDQCLRFTEAESAANWRRTFDEGLPSSDRFLVAIDEQSAAVGYAWGSLCAEHESSAGELGQIMLLPAHQRRGLGRMLVGRIAQHLEGHGVRRMRVEVLRVNPNRGFYEHVGARYVSERPFDWDGVTMSMCQYEWEDTRALIQSDERRTSR